MLYIIKIMPMLEFYYQKEDLVVKLSKGMSINFHCRNGRCQIIDLCLFIYLVVVDHDCLCIISPVFRVVMWLLSKVMVPLK